MLRFLIRFAFAAAGLALAAHLVPGVSYQNTTALVLAALLLGIVNALLRPILDGDANVVYGARSYGGHAAYSFWFVLGNKGLAIWASFLFDAWLTDIETCLKVAPTTTWRELDLQSNGFGIEAELTGKLLARGERIFEVPISYRARGREEGKKIQWTDGVAALWILARIRLRGK